MEMNSEIREKKFPFQEEIRRGFRLKGRSWQAFWQCGVFRFIIATGICFLILTGIAMLFYPGGTMTDPHVHGYAFFTNFLSDLGRTSTPSGQDNLVSHLLFMIALIIGAFAIMLLFAAFTQFFSTSGTARWLSHFGAIFGLITGLCFIGVAVVPLNRYGLLHNLFLYTASMAFIVAYLLLFLAVLLTPGFPRRCVYAFVGFAFLIAGSLLVFTWTFFFGPAPGTLAWEIVHATGQKIIVAASILTGLLEILFVQPLLQNNNGLPGKLGQTSTNFQVKRGKSASIMGIDDSLPGNAAPHLEFFD
jgi:hypothetical protein